MEAVCSLLMRGYRSPEGAALRQKQKETTALLRRMLLSAGLPVMRSDSHITPLIVGDALICNEMSRDLLNDFGRLF